MNYETNQRPNWESLCLPREKFDHSVMNAILAGEVACAVIDDFYPEEACAALVERIRSRGLRTTFGGQNVESHGSGIAAIEYKDRGEAEYLNDCALANAERQFLLRSQPDPTMDVLAVLGTAWPAGAKLASHGDRDYVAGAIRVLKKAYEHNDWAPRDLPGWAIANISAQLSWHLYLSAPRKGGEFKVWQRTWKPEDERLYRLSSGERKYDTAFLEPVPYISEAPAIGKLVLFETRHYHAFEAAEGPDQCLVISAFLGVTNESEPLIFW